LAEWIDVERLGHRIEADHRVGAEVAEPHDVTVVDEDGVGRGVFAGGHMSGTAAWAGNG
jgi:hypothetical protein